MVARTILHYRLLEKLGEGAMGEVYLARDLTLGRTVAIKSLKAASAGSDSDRARFLREAKAVSQIDHPNVVTLFDVIEEEGTMHLVMQHVRGKSLREVIAERKLEIGEALRVGSDVAAGLRAAHAIGVVHRDIKPANVMVTPDGSCKVLDFGVAHLAGVDTTTLTGSGEIVGTLHYMAPEMVRGEPVDERVDIYSLGVVLFEILAGQVPFAGREQAALLHAIVERDPPLLSRFRTDLPADLEALVARALAKNPERRHATAGELLDELEAARRSLAASAAEPTQESHYARERRRRTARQIALGVLLVAALIAAPEVLHRIQPPHRARIMVAPFHGSRSDPEQEWLSSALMDCLIAALTGLEGYEIVPRRTVTSAVELLSSQNPRVAHAGLFGAAREVGATHLVTGTYTETGPITRVTCELQDLEREVVLASWSEDVRDLEAEFLTTVDGFAEDVAHFLGTRRGEDRAGTATSPYHTQSIEAIKHFEEGIKDFERSNFPAARENFRAAVAADSAFTRAYIYLAWTTNEKAVWERYLTLAMKYRHSAPPPLRELVEAEWTETHGQQDEAIRRYEEILARHPDEVLARGSLAYLYFIRREWLKAIGEYEALRERNPFDYSFYSYLTSAHLEIGHQREALRLAQEWRERLPKQAYPLMWLSQLHGWLGDYATALALCDSLAAIHPGAELAHRGTVLIHLGRLKEAEATLLRWKANPGGYYSRSQPLAMLAQVDYMTRDFPEGSRRIQEALSIQDDSYNRWIAGLLAVASSDLVAAEAHALAIAEEAGVETDSVAVEAFSSRRFYYNLKGEIALARGDASGAVRMHERALHHSSRMDDPVFRTPFGVALAAAGDTAKAIAAFEQALEFNPNYPEALLNLGRTAAARGDREHGAQALRRLDSLWGQADPDYVRKEELEKALQALGG